MNNNNNPGYTGQVPDHRLTEMQEQLRRSNEENQRLRVMVDQIAQQQAAMMQGQQQQQQPQSQFTPEIDTALSNKFQQMFAPHFNQVRQTIGGLADQNDLLNFQVKFGGDTLEKYGDKIERIRQERQRMNQYISREDAYRHIYFEENGKKPKESVVVGQAQNQQPLFDPYTGMMINPPTPATQTPQVANVQGTQGQQTQQGQTQQQVPQNLNGQQNIQGQQPINNLQQQPVQQAVTVQSPNLPPANMNPVGAQIPPQTQTGGTQLDIASNDQALDQWANKFGDLSL